VELARIEVTENAHFGGVRVHGGTLFAVRAEGIHDAVLDPKREEGKRAHVRSLGTQVHADPLLHREARRPVLTPCDAIDVIVIAVAA